MTGNFIGIGDGENNINTIDSKRNIFYGGAIPRNCSSVITPSNDDDLDVPGVPYVEGNGGAIKVTLVGGGECTYYPEQGEFVPVQVKKVHATGTTATGIKIHY